MFCCTSPPKKKEVPLQKKLTIDERDVENEQPAFKPNGDQQIIATTIASLNNSLILSPVSPIVKPIPQDVADCSDTTCKQFNQVPIPEIPKIDFNIEQQPPSALYQQEIQFFDTLKIQQENENLESDALFSWVKEFDNFNTLENYNQIYQYIQGFPCIKNSNETRDASANKSGGKECKDKKLISTIRKIGKDIIKQVGQKILSGSFNLTTISFPIKAMIPKSALEKALSSTCLFPMYINKAALSNDPLERMKLLIAATIGSYVTNCSFLKPLNPILGETIHSQFCDGTNLYAEQISHHPPISYFLVYGPQNNYKFSGYYQYEAKAGLNSLSLKNLGKRKIEFQDGQKIEYNFGSEEYNGSFWGDMKLEVLGKMKFIDTQNELVAEFSFDNVRWKSSDYFQGKIKQKGKEIEKIYGSYMGFLEFNNVRYWDSSEIQPFKQQIINEQLLSDHNYRKDKQYLLRGDIVTAQQEKEKLENLQREDGKLRNNNNKKSKKKK